MAVQLRFRCSHKGEQMGYGAQKKIGSVKLSPIYPSNLEESDPAKAEMEAFYNATPAGEIAFSTINEAALAQFEVGDDWYITLDRVPPAQ